MLLSFSPRCQNCLFYTFCFSSTSSDCYFCLMCLEVKVWIICEYCEWGTTSSAKNSQIFVHPEFLQQYFFLVSFTEIFIFLYVKRVNRVAILDSKTQIKKKTQKFWRKATKNWQKLSERESDDRKINCEAQKRTSRK